ncbi:hypothetical protein [Kitasatospora sp. NPDC090091]|uniref:hypothetical protein n=1 Tax=Kitasatospora sp. NPDC090091 TaxID=3364081 RepID=UPI0037FD44F5
MKHEPECGIRMWLNARSEARNVHCRIMRTTERATAMPIPPGLRRQCESMLASLPIPDPFSVEGFAEALAAERGRKIVIEPIPFDPGPGVPTGLWVRLPSVDVIFVQANTSPAHKALIILHELAHIAFGHECRVSPDLLEKLFPGLTPELIRSTLLTRDGYDDEQEAQAEMLALLLAEAFSADEGSTRQGRAVFRSLSFPVRRILGWRRAA